MKRFWRALERLAAGAVMLEWQRELGRELDRARHFLQLSNTVADTFPCTNPGGCGYPHRIEERGRGGWQAVCDPEEWCAPILLRPEDRLVFHRDVRRLCDGIAGALRLGRPIGPKGTRARAERVGVYGTGNAQLYLMFPSDSAWMAREVERLFGNQPDPFVLLTPTGSHCSAEVESALRRQLCAHIALHDVLDLTANGALQARPSAAVLFGAFGQRLTTGPGLVKTVERIDRNIEAVVKQKLELSAAKARLEEMHGEGMFAFARHIDKEAREQFLAVMACGDVAKAARDLGLKDSTLRSKLEKWPARGKAYAALAEIVRWRKAIKKQAGIELAKRVASGAERDVDFPALIRDVIVELEELNPENWGERCGDLAEALRKVVS